MSQYSIKTTSTYFHLYHLQEFNFSYTCVRCNRRSPTHRHSNILLTKLQEALPLHLNRVLRDKDFTVLWQMLCIAELPPKSTAYCSYVTKFSPSLFCLELNTLLPPTYFKKYDAIVPLFFSSKPFFHISYTNSYTCSQPNRSYPYILCSHYNTCLWCNSNVVGGRQPLVPSIIIFPLNYATVVGTTIVCSSSF
jgi:hypothetical protein